MFKYILVDGVKYLVDLKGQFIKTADDEKVEAPEGAEEFVPEEAPETGTEEGAEEEADVEGLKTFVQSTVKTQAEEIIKNLDLTGMVGKEAKKAFAEAINAADEKDAGLDAEAFIKGLKEGVGANGASSKEMRFKTLSELSSLTGEVIEEDRKPEISRDPVKTPFVEELADSSTTGSNKVTWVEVLTETGDPATTAELAKFPEKDYTFGVQSADVYKVSVMSKASNEILEDAPQLVSFVKSSLIEDLQIKFDELLLSGTGVSQFTGILTTAPAFTGGALAGTMAVGTANKLDVLRAAIAEIVVAGEGKFQPTAIALNPIDSASLDLEKGSDGHYVMPPFTTADRTTVKGVRIVDNTMITAGDFLVGDFRKMKVANRRGLALQVATENVDDFEKDMISMRLSRRAASYVRTNDVGAFLEGDFASAITLLEE